MKVLHILPRWSGGGPERDLLQLAHQDLVHSRKIERRILALDRPLSAPLILRARQLGVTVVAGDWRDEVSREVEAADLVEIRFWNHPLLHELLALSLPPCRVVFRSAIAGHSPPQVIPRRLWGVPHAWVLTAPEGFGLDFDSTEVPSIHRIPALADMQRLSAYAPRQHGGIEVTYLGSLEFDKLHPEVLSIVSSLDEGIRCQFIGDMSESSRAHLERSMAQLGLAGIVTFRGHREDIALALGETDFFIYPLNPAAWSTSDKSLQEAMWLGLPPVLLAGTAMDGWVQHGKTGLVAPSTTVFAEYVNQLARDGDLRRHLGRGAKRYARVHFDPARNSEQIERVHRRLTSTPKREWVPRNREGLSGSEMFLQSVDLDASQFEEYLEKLDDPSGYKQFLLRHGEGGIAHYLKHFPQDPLLRRWYNLSTRK